MGIVKHIKNLMKGLGITGKHLGRHAVTLQYPEEKMEMFERSRGIVVLLSDQETGELNCTSCQLCERACPTRAIKVEWHKEEKKKILDRFDIDFGLCCFCGMCEEACNFSAIKMAAKYEFSVMDKGTLVWQKDKLQEVGRDVPYEDKRKKRAEAQAKAKAAAAAKKAAAEKLAEPKEEAKPVEPTKEEAAPKADAEPARSAEPTDGDKKTEGGEV